MSAESLEDVLNGVEPKQEEKGEIEPVTDESDTEQDQPGKPEAEKPEGGKADDEPGKPETPTGDTEESWTKAMALDERRKRQAIEEELKELKASQPESTEEKKTPDVFEDQQAFVNSLTEETDRKLQNQKVELSRQFMMDSKPDYEEKEALFLEMAKDNPALSSELKKAANPAKFVYDQAIKYEEYKKVQDIDAYKASLRAEVEQEMKEQAEFKKGQPKIPASLASKPSGDKNEQPDDSLESLYG